VLTCAEDPPALPGATALPPGSLRQVAARFAAVGRRGGVVVGGDTGPLRVADAVGARTVGLFGPTPRDRYGLSSADIQGLPDCPHRRPLAITEQVCWWHGDCPLSASGPACLADIGVETVLATVLELLS
jgi:ADP-heptose:LPS heptosyltransferase